MTIDYEAVEASFHRCMDEGDFFDAFYEQFLVQSEEIPAFFADTDFVKQKQVIRVSVLMMIRLGHGLPETHAAIEKLGDSHSTRGHDIPPHLYQVWLDTLCECVRQFDPVFTPEIEEQWRDTMKLGIDLMLSKR